MYTHVYVLMYICVDVYVYKCFVYSKILQINLQNNIRKSLETSFP